MFIVLYLVTSIISGDFYKVPITVAFMASSIFAIAISGGYPLAKRIEIYSKGASTDNMMMMLWIFVLAGAFANSAKDMGSIDATVNLTLSVLPDNMLLPGLFLAACFISYEYRNERWNYRCTHPYRSRYCHFYGEFAPFCRRNRRRWFVLWRQPFVY